MKMASNMKMPQFFSSFFAFFVTEIGAKFVTEEKH